MEKLKENYEKNLEEIRRKEENRLNKIYESKRRLLC